MKLKLLSVIACAALISACQPVNRFADMTISKSVPQNGTITLSEAANMRRDCTNAGPVDVQVIEQPLHGKVSLIRTTTVPFAGSYFMRTNCPKSKIPAVRANYTADRGYLGSDKVSIRTIFADGDERIRRYRLEVK